MTPSLVEVYCWKLEALAVLTHSRSTDSRDALAGPT